MQDLLNRLEQMSNCKEVMRQACKRNGLNTALAGQLTIAKLKFLSERFKKAYQTSEEKIKTNWVENQLKAYNWILIAVSALENAKISAFCQKQWVLLQSIFPFKTRNFLKFQARRFLQQKISKNRNWSEEQSKLLFKIVNEIQTNDRIKLQNGEKKEEQQLKEENQNSVNELRSCQKDEKKQRVHWNEVARSLFEYSNEVYFRSAKHCRQRWYNYIDPTIQRGKWKETEDQRLINLVKEKGKKWAEIAATMHRTEHNVKNRYHSLQLKVKKDAKRKIALKPKNAKTSIEQPKIQIIQVKQENDKIPMLTITQFPEKIRSKQSKSQIQFNSYLQDVDNIQQNMKFEDSNRFQKGQMSFFTYSPHNLTPFMGSPSPITFHFKSFASSSQQNFKDFFVKGSSTISNDKQ